MAILVISVIDHVSHPVAMKTVKMFEVLTPTCTGFVHMNKDYCEKHLVITFQ